MNILFLLYYGPKLYLPLNRLHFAFSCFLRLECIGIAIQSHRILVVLVMPVSL